MSLPLVYVELLAARLHDIYQKEASQQGRRWHPDDYTKLTEDVKEFDRVLARWILAHWSPNFPITEGFPPA
jgi:hypothetical protein